MKYFVLLFLFLSWSAQADYRIGIDQIGIATDGLFFQASGDYVFVSPRFKVDGFSIGPGVGFFQHRFSSTVPAPGEVEGFRSKTVREAALGVIFDYQKGNFYANLLIAFPRFSTMRTRIKSERVETIEYDGELFDVIVREKEQRWFRKNDAETFFTFGVQF